MANGERCKKCGYQQGSHESSEAVLKSGKPCTGFISELKHAKKCPVLGCNGNCNDTIMRKIEEDKQRMQVGEESY